MNRVPENLISLPRLLADDAAVYRTILSRLHQTQLQQDPSQRAEWHMAFHPAKCTRLPVTRSENVLKVKLPIENVLRVKLPIENVLKVKLPVTRRAAWYTF